MNISLFCDYCGNKYELSKTLYNKRLKRNKHFYCSTECMHKSRIKLATVKCYKCNKEIKRTPYKLNKSKKCFCSKTCANSYNNTLKTKVSKNTYRRIAFEHYEHKCAICGWDEDKRILEVHHIDEDRENNDFKNLIILCPIHHRYLTLHIKTLQELLVRI